MNEHRIHTPITSQLDPNWRFVKRRAYQPKSIPSILPAREAGELNLQRLAAAAAIEALRAERRGRHLLLPADGTSIKSPALRLLAQQAKRDLARLHANRRADAHRGQEG